MSRRQLRPLREAPPDTRITCQMRKSEDLEHWKITSIGASTTSSTTVRVVRNMKCHLKLNEELYSTNHEMDVIKLSDVLESAGVDEEYFNKVTGFLKHNFHPLKASSELEGVEQKSNWITFPQALRLYWFYKELRAVLYYFVHAVDFEDSAKHWSWVWTKQVM